MYSEENQYLVKMNALPPPDVKTYYTTPGKDLPVYNGFSVFLHSKDERIVSGNYKVGMGIMKNKDEMDIKLLNQMVSFQ